MTKNILLKVLLIFMINFTMQHIEAATVTGKILDKQDERPMIGAKIWLLNHHKLNATTNRNGSFTIHNVPNGDYKLVVSCIGFQRLETNITVNDNESNNHVLKLDPVSYYKDAVFIIGDQLQGQAKALNQQKGSSNIMNIVSSDQAGKFPDANIGDAMKRITGIAVQYDQGEARFGLIRGTSPALSSITINGDRIPSAEGETRSVQLDLIPADMVSSIEVNKTLTPDMDADAIGGSVNLVTKNFINKEKLSVTAGSGMNFFSQKPIWNGALTIGSRFFDELLGVTLSGSYNNNILGSDNVEAEWLAGPGNEAYLGDLQIRKYNIQRVRKSLSAGLNFKFDDVNEVFFNALYNHRNDWENRYRLRLRFDKGDATKVGDTDYPGMPDQSGTVKNVQIIRQLKGGSNDKDTDNARLEDQRTLNFSLGGEHEVFDLMKINWQTNWAKASEERPFERYIGYRYKKGIVKQITSDPNKPNFQIEGEDDLSKYTLDELSEQYKYTDEKDLNAKIDFELPIIDNGDYKNKVKFGGRLRNKDKKRENNFFNYKPIGTSIDNLSQTNTFNVKDDNFLVGDYKIGTFTTKEFLGELDLNNPNLFKKIDAIEKYASANYTAKEKIFAGYAQIDQSIGDNISVLAGARLEYTDVNYNANQLVYDEKNKENPYSVSPNSGSKNYLNVLPNVNVKYSLHEDLVLRAAFTNSIARPNYYQLAPYREIKISDNEISEGNTELNPTKSMNLDLIADYYLKSVGIISAGVFYKNISDYIYTNVTRNYLDVTTNNTFKYLYKPENGAKADLYGIEVSFQRQLDFLPDFLKGLGFYANYTFTNSEATGLKIAGRENEKVGLPGNANHMINTSLSYEMHGINLRLSLNYTNDYIDEFGESEFYDRYYDKQLFMDLNGSYEFLEGMRVYFELNNITNQPLRYYQGKGHSERTMQVEYYNLRFNLGFKYDL